MKIIFIAMSALLLGATVFNIYSLNEALEGGRTAGSAPQVGGITITEVEEEFTGDFYVVFNLDQSIADLCIDHMCQMVAQVKVDDDYVYAGPPMNFCQTGFCEVRFYTSFVGESQMGRVLIRVLEGDKLLKTFASNDMLISPSQ